MSQIRIECPKCETKGKLDAAALPAAGAKIRCPSCSHVFFVENKPDTGEDAAAQVTNSNAAESATSTPETEPSMRTSARASSEGASAPAPETPAEAPAAGSPTAESPEKESPDTEPSAGPALTGRRRASVPKLSVTAPVVDAPAAADTTSTTSEASPTPEPEPTSAAPADDIDGVAELEEVEVVAGPPRTESTNAYVARASSSASRSRRVVLSGTASTAAVGSQTGPVPVPGRSDTAPKTANHRGAWRVQSNGMTYDFPDGDNLRAWLETRTTHAGITASTDKGETYHPLSEFPELAGVRARGFRTTTLRVPVQSDAPVDYSTGSTPGVSPRDYMSAGPAAVSESITGSTPAIETPEGDAAPAPEPTKKKRRGPPKKKKKIGSKLRPEIDDVELSPVQRAVGLLLLLVASALGAYFYYIYDPTPRIPDTPAGNQFLWVLSAMNGGAAGMNEMEVERHFAPEVLEVLPADRLIDELRYWHERNPGYRYEGVNGNSTDFFLEARIATPLQDAGVVTVMVEPMPPHRLIEFRIRPAQ